MIRIQGLCKSFGKFPVLNDVQLEFQMGQSVALVGPNGSGKTTLIKILLGLVIPDKGEVSMDGKSILGKCRYREQIGYMPQISRFPDNMKVKQLFELMKSVRKETNQYDMELYQRFGIEEMAKKRLNALSGGMRQKVSAALAFMFHPQLLVLDEPTAGLDPVSNEILKDKLQKTREEGKLVLITSHILNDLDDITTDVVYLMDGTVKFYKTLEQLKLETSEHRLNRIMARILNPKEAYV